jgi:hypothetical protein
VKRSDHLLCYAKYSTEGIKSRLMRGQSVRCVALEELACSEFDVGNNRDGWRKLNWSHACSLIGPESEGEHFTALRKHFLH